MLVTIDESGCAGFKFNKGSSPYFLAGMVIFESFQSAEQASQAIQNLKVEIGVKPEFRFHNSSFEKKDAFFQMAASLDFNLRILVVNKSLLHSPKLISSKNSFYSFFVKSLMKYDNGALADAVIKIDGSGDRVFQKELASYLKRSLKAGKIRKIKIVDSKTDNLVQLADMSVGAIARSYYPEKKHHDRWRKILTPKIKDIWEFQ